MKKVWRILWGVLECIIIVVTIMMTAVLLSKNKYGYTQFGNYTISTIDRLDSKEMKGLKAGDLLIVHNKNDIKKGDVIYYYVVNDESYLIRSDSVAEVETDNYNSIYTIDNEGMMLVSSNRVLGKDTIVCHKLGSLLDTLESRLGFLFLVLLPVIVIFIYQVFELVKVFNDEVDKAEKTDKKEKDNKKNKK
ncbi:MAG: hypothetical protein IKF71_05965 [Bacilli bacterium]|nr:hypothetical protein [Bacilli bacterium]